MRYLSKFVNYLNESNSDITDLSKEDLEELLLPMVDLGIEYSFTTPRVITEGEFSGYKSLNIQFRNSFQMGESGGYSEQIIDTRFWDFLDELIALKNRLESSRVSINTNWRHYIVVTFIQKAKVEGDTFLLQKFYNDLGRKMNSAKSDFVNSMTKRLDLENKQITLNVSNFWTDRKWSLFKRDLDTTNFDVRIEKSKGMWDENAVITFTLKK